MNCLDYSDCINGGIALSARYHRIRSSLVVNLLFYSSELYNYSIAHTMSYAAVASHNSKYHRSVPSHKPNSSPRG